MDQSNVQTNQNKEQLCFTTCITFKSHKALQNILEKMAMKEDHPKRVKKQHSFESLDTAIVVEIPSPELSRHQKKQISELLNSANDILKPPVSSPFHLPYLSNGSRFAGQQSSINQNYTVRVEIKSVDLCQDFLCGYLTIDGLTEMYPTLTTFFEAQIIGEHHKFSTRGKWRSNYKVDYNHWMRFPAFKELLKEQGWDTEVKGEPPDLDKFTVPSSLKAPGLFMRWKELFLVPDHRIEKIEGASYEGFYYMYYDKATRTFEGYYFHKEEPSTDQNQRILLKYEEESMRGYYAYR
jgi:hypothetical protein